MCGGYGGWSVHLFFNITTLTATYLNLQVSDIASWFSNAMQTGNYNYYMGTSPLGYIICIELTITLIFQKVAPLLHAQYNNYAISFLS